MNVVSFRRRSIQPELMDQPDCSSTELIRTLRQFRIVNLLFSRSRHLLRKFIIRDMTAGPRRLYTVLDLGAGGGDLSRWLVRTASRITSRQLRVVCLDRDPRVVGHMESEFGGDPQVEVRIGSADEIEELGPFDYVFANHFLHHLGDEEIGPMIRRICRSTRRLFLINDLLRSPLAYLGFSMFAFFFLKGGFALEDGRISIRKGFLTDELTPLEQTDGWDVRVFTSFPARVCIVGKPTVHASRSGPRSISSTPGTI